MNDESMPDRRFPRWWLWLFCLMLIVGLLGVVMSIRARRLPSMNPQRFEVAKTLWNEQELTDYEITIKVSGRQPGEYAVSVQHGIATAATLDGRDLTRPRTFGTWSVDGMFETLQRDLDMHEANGNLILGAEFHETLGIPMRYQRIEMQTGVHDVLQWEVTRFHSP